MRHRRQKRGQLIAPRSSQSQRLLSINSASLDELLRDARRELSRDGAFRPDDTVLEGLVRPRLSELLPTHAPEEWEQLALCESRRRSREGHGLLDTSARDPASRT